MIRELIAVAAGGALGSMLRYALSGIALAESVWCGFPLGTFAVNAAGSLLIGVVLGAELPPPAVRLLAVGFCGGFTTFSTFSADTLRLLRAGNYGPAAAYAALSIAVCLACTAAGWWLGTLAAKR